MNCDYCEKPLVPVFPEYARRREDRQYVDCLHVTISGGYGEYIDEVVEMTLCKKCADEFCALNTFILPTEED
jgi:hypothetical protein